MTPTMIFDQMKIVLPEIANRVVSYRKTRTDLNTIFVKLTDMDGQELVFRFINKDNWYLKTKKGEL